jgi:hypothetical protein
MAPTETIVTAAPNPVMPRRMSINPETTTRKLITMPHELAERIDDWRHARKIGSEAEAMRQLLDYALTHMPASPPVRKTRGGKRR